MASHVDALDGIVTIEGSSMSGASVTIGNPISIGTNTQSQITATTVPASTGVVPSRQQYLDLKALHPRAILLYRLGSHVPVPGIDTEL